MSEAHSVTDDDIKELMRKVKNERQLEHIQAEIAKSSKDGETQLTKMKRLELWLAAQNRNDERVPFPDLPQCEPLALKQVTDAKMPDISRLLPVGSGDGTQEHPPLDLTLISAQEWIAVLNNTGAFKGRYD